MRMLMNNLDEEVAERPQDLVVYGGTGKAARTWDDFHRIVASLADYPAVLRALGIGHVDLYGDSYGTFFGQTFAVRHPERLRTVTCGDVAADVARLRKAPVL